MTNSAQLPPAFALLADEPNLAVESALVEALPTLPPAAQAAALAMIERRGYAQGQAAVVIRFARFDRHTQHVILSRIDSYFGAIRAVVGSASLDERLSGLEMVERSGDARLSYVLGTALRMPCLKTRERAAAVLHELASRAASGGGGSDGSTGSTAHGDPRADLVAALIDAVRCWEHHLQPRVLAAAMYLADELTPALVEKMNESRSHITVAVNGVLEGASDPRLAGFAMRALAIAPLRKVAAGVISAAQDDAFIRALAAHGRLLADGEIRKACLWIRDLRFLQNGVDRLATMPAGEAVPILWLIGASGIAAPRKAQHFREVLALNVPELSSAVVHQLTGDRADWATELLTLVSSRGRDELAQVAAQELASRRAAAANVPASAPLSPAGEPAQAGSRTSVRGPWDRLWDRFDDLSGEERAAAAGAARIAGIDLLVPLRAKLASGQPVDRARALRVARTLRLVPELEEQVYRLTSDADPVVRSAAIAVLIDLPGVTGERILRRAVDDSDHRVQANAIEVLDALESGGRQGLIQPKLGSPNGRVRANAVKALLRLEFKQAGEVLLDMLDHPSRTQRLSALWVVEHLHLESLLHRLERMSRADDDERVRHRAGRVMSGLTKGLAAARRADAAWPGAAAHKAGGAS